MCELMEGPSLKNFFFEKDEINPTTARLQRKINGHLFN